MVSGAAFVLSKALNYVAASGVDWFPAVVIDAPLGAEFRWHDPFVWMTSEVDVWVEDQQYGRNIFWIGKRWSPAGGLDYWVIPTEEWLKNRG